MSEKYACQICSECHYFGDDCPSTTRRHLTDALLAMGVDAVQKVVDEYRLQQERLLASARERDRVWDAYRVERERAIADAGVAIDEAWRDRLEKVR